MFINSRAYHDFFLNWHHHWPLYTPIRLPIPLLSILIRQWTEVLQLNLMNIERTKILETREIMTDNDNDIHTANREKS